MKAFKDIIELEEQSQTLKERVGIFGVHLNQREFQMKEAYFKEWFPEYETIENWSEKYYQIKVEKFGYRFFALIPKESEASENEE